MAANTVDLDSDPAKPLAVVSIGKQLRMTCGAISTFSIVNDVAKYSATTPSYLRGSDSCGKQAEYYGTLLTG